MEKTQNPLTRAKNFFEEFIIKKEDKMLRWEKISQALNSYFNASYLTISINALSLNYEYYLLLKEFMKQVIEPAEKINPTAYLWVSDSVPKIILTFRKKTIELIAIFINIGENFSFEELLEQFTFCYQEEKNVEKTFSITDEVCKAILIQLEKEENFSKEKKSLFCMYLLKHYEEKNPLYNQLSSYILPEMKGVAVSKELLLQQLK